MDIGQIIRDRAAANGVDPAVLARIAQVESNNNPNAAAKGSSAKGLFQFVDPTFAKYAPKGADPFDPATSADAGARLLKDNASGLSSAGLETSPGALYLAHFAGLGGAKSLLSADPTTPVGDVLGSAAVKANPFLQNMTVADLKNWASSKMGTADAGPVASSAASTATQPSAPTGLLNSPPDASAPDTGADQALASIKNLMAGQQQQEAPPPLQIQTAPPPRRIDQATLQKMLSSPLRSGFALG